MGSILKITEVGQIFALFFTRLCFNFDKNVFGYILGGFSQIHLVILSVPNHCLQVHKHKKHK
jgi:hypothetical protein